MPSDIGSASWSKSGLKWHPVRDYRVSTQARGSLKPIRARVRVTGPKPDLKRGSLKSQVRGSLKSSVRAASISVECRWSEGEMWVKCPSVEAPLNVYLRHQLGEPRTDPVLLNLILTRILTRIEPAS